MASSRSPSKTSTIEQARALAAFEPEVVLTSNPQTTRERALHAAIELFAARGFDATSMRDIASAVDVKAPALYNHFASKNEIAVIAMRQQLAAFFAAVLGPFGDGPAAAELEGVVRRHVVYQIENRELAQAADALLGKRTLQRILPEDEYRRLVGAQRDYLLFTQRLIADAADDLPADVAVLALTIVGICDRTAVWFDPAGPLAADEVAEQLWTVCARILRL